MSDNHGNVGPYALKRLLATGSQSQVWHATGPGGDVALKLARTDAHRAALEREVGVLRLGEHPRLPRLIDHAPDFAWVALEHVRGSQIDQWAQVQDVEDVVRAGVELLEALTWLHGQGLLHGDVKPSNLLVDTEGHIRLIDLGISGKPDQRPAGFTGTLGYAAPELLQGGAATIPSADLYGVGALLYTCLTGRPPFVAADPAALTYLPLVSLPAPPAAFNPELPEALGDLLLDLLARDPKRRPRSLKETRIRLQKSAEGAPRPPILGMLEERETLRRAVVGAADGEPRVALVYGPPGCGRRTLIGEAVGYATREGVSFLKSTDARAILEAARSGKGPISVVMRGTSPNAQKLAQVILKESLPCLLLLHADRPVPALEKLGAIHLTPSPLSTLDVARLARRLGADDDLAETWCRESLGLPIAVHGRIRAWRRQHLDDPLEYDHLSAEAKRILEALKPGRLAIPDLAQRVGQSESALLDHCEALFAEELVVVEDDGDAVRLADGVQPA